ncbi:MAG: hypothetical protein MI802_28825 [Desulfobacterales bacterium]|nr:hypothetical protein [Desulfobacterales bacterium]
MGNKPTSGQYTLLFMAVIAGAATLLPFPPASEPSILGYRALCTFSPISTVLLFYGGLLVFGKIKRG